MVFIFLLSWVYCFLPWEKWKLLVAVYVCCHTNSSIAKPLVLKLWFSSFDSHFNITHRKYLLFCIPCEIKFWGFFRRHAVAVDIFSTYQILGYLSALWNFRKSLNLSFFPRKNSLWAGCWNVNGFFPVDLWFFRLMFLLQVTQCSSILSIY